MVTGGVYAIASNNSGFDSWDEVEESALVDGVGV
jgi:hypothetical protein